MRDARYLPALRFRALTRFYDPLIAFSTRERAFKSRLVEIASPEPNERVLDLGCGTGTLAMAIKRRQPAAEVTGVDGDGAMLDQGRTKAAEALLDLDFERAMAQALPYDDDTFDVVVSSLFFHHLVRAAKERVGTEMVRVLRPGGRVAIADWGPPGDPVMSVASLGIRLLDGADRTRDNHAGRLPAILEAAGLHDLVGHDSFRTIFGRIVLLTGRSGGAREPHDNAA